jgi:hypothetical protein
LTGKTGQQDIKVRDSFRSNLLNIPFGFLSEVGLIGYGRKFIPFGCKNAFTTGFFKAFSGTADPGE